MIRLGGKLEWIPSRSNAKILGPADGWTRDHNTMIMVGQEETIGGTVITIGGAAVGMVATASGIAH